MTILRNTFFLYRRCFLQLIAIYLFGWLVRYGIVQLAVAVATEYGMLWGNFLLPLSPLTMLLTYLGMFWVLRRYILPDATETGVQAFLNTALQIVLPAFAIFVFWKLHLHDERDYQFGTRLGLKYLRDTSVLPTDIEAKQRLLAEQSHLVHPSTTALLLIVLALLAVRRLLTALATRLPGTIRLFFGALVEPIRICLIAGMFWYCIQRAGQLSINRAIDLSLPDSPKETSTPLG